MYYLFKKSKNGKSCPYSRFIWCHLWCHCLTASVQNNICQFSIFILKWTSVSHLWCHKSFFYNQHYSSMTKLFCFSFGVLRKQIPVGNYSKSNFNDTAALRKCCAVVPVLINFADLDTSIQVNHHAAKPWHLAQRNAELRM